MSKNWNEMYTCDSSESYQYHTCASIEIEVKIQPEDATNSMKDEHGITVKIRNGKCE